LYWAIASLIAYCVILTVDQPAEYEKYRWGLKRGGEWGARLLILVLEAPVFAIGRVGSDVFRLIKGAGTCFAEVYYILLGSDKSQLYQWWERKREESETRQMEQQQEDRRKEREQRLRGTYNGFGELEMSLETLKAIDRSILSKDEITLLDELIGRTQHYLDDYKTLEDPVSVLTEAAAGSALAEAVEQTECAIRVARGELRSAKDLTQRVLSGESISSL
jgi:hypothetical protein